MNAINKMTTNDWNEYARFCYSYVPVVTPEVLAAQDAVFLMPNQANAENLAQACADVVMVVASETNNGKLVARAAARKRQLAKLKDLMNQAAAR